MKKTLLFLLSIVMLVVFAGCSASTGGAAKGKRYLTIAWLPNESGADLRKLVMKLEK